MAVGTVTEAVIVALVMILTDGCSCGWPVGNDAVGEENVHIGEVAFAAARRLQAEALYRRIDSLVVVLAVRQSVLLSMHHRDGLLLKIAGTGADEVPTFAGALK